MAKPDRGALIAKTHKVLKKHYKPVDYVERPLLENLLFAACLENNRYEEADAAFTALSKNFFDWNEVRVSTVEELVESISMLNEPKTAAANVKKILYSVFESVYAFELEGMKKQNLGAAIQKLEKFEGVTPFVAGVATQASLGGHSIPLDRGAFGVLKVVGIAADSDESKGVVPGLERAVPKSKGVEFGSLLHQMGADLVASPYSTNLQKIFLEITPSAKDRFPKRPSKVVKAPEPPPETKKARKPEDKPKHVEAEKKSAPAKKVEPKADHTKKAIPPARKPQPVSPKKKSGTSIAKRKPR